MTTGHGGNLRALAARAGRDPAEILDFSASVNPLGPPPGLGDVLSGAIGRLVHYPDPENAELVEALAAHYRLRAAQIVAGNGSSELLFALARAMEYDRAVIPVPSYSDYAAAVERAGRPVVPLALGERTGFALDLAALEDQLHGHELVLLGQPNNPTGLAFDNRQFRALAARRPTTWFVVDEAFADFIEGYSSLACDRPDNVVLVRSFTKFYAMPGLRLGFAVADECVAGQIREQLTPWSVGTLAQAAGVAVLAEAEYGRQTVAYVGRQRRQLVEQLQRLPGLYVYPSAANFLLVRLDRARLTAPALAERLLRAGVAVRTFGTGEHLDERFFRVAVRTPAENQRLCDALGEILAASGATAGLPSSALDATAGLPSSALDAAGDSSTRARCTAGQASSGTSTRGARKTPALMIQGTSSNAGKSILTAALCRILFQNGVRVAPFKAQNMSLNSFVTRQGGEMGRAQVVQAQACRLEPDVRMNPVLLKPNSDTGSQVLVRGKPVGNMGVDEYVQFKPRAFAAACECYDSLAAEFDAMLLEGAGSPGEVNLKSHDIVNMRMAEHAGAPVLVVGDIDRGGVFASFVGTLAVLDDWERRLVAGWIVNRFRGDAGLLQPALDYMLRRTGRPVLGVVPYLASLGIPQEDSVEFKSGQLDADHAGQHGNGQGINGDAVEIAVIDLPHISNFTDLDAFRGESDVRLRIVRTPADLRQPDAVLIPGSKNTLADLGYLRQSGLAGRIDQLARAGHTEVVGICGGFQMLGREIRDPEALESAAVAAPGLGLLETVTVMNAEKTLARTTARHAPSALEVVGYEIHHGQTDAGDSPALFRRSDGRPVGCGSADGRVWGTYLHGVFDADPFRRWFIDHLRVRRGLAPLGRVIAPYDIEPALDRLADAVRSSLDMEAITRLMKL